MTAIAAGHSHSCGLRTDGTVQCWGNNVLGQLGDGTQTNRLLPTAVFDLTGAVAIATGTAHTRAVRADGTVRCRGFNGDGQLGDGTQEMRLVPIPVVGLTGMMAAAAGTTHTCAIGADGGLRCWGSNALVNCEADQRVRIEVTLTQAGRSSHGHAAARCTGRLEGYPVEIPAHGRNGFQLGPATAEAEAVIEARGQVLQTEEWTREVELAVKP